ncbi:MAG TPA: prepilin peptidase [Stellaceae bacterium]|nr:prepilin peptidase [Stellaceae bacterium]
MLEWLALGAYAAALVAAGLTDLVRYEIPNGASLVLVAAFGAIVPSLSLPAAAAHVTAGLAVLAATAACFALRLMGGGDAKLLAAAALWMGWRNLFAFIVLTALAGAFLGLALLLLRWCLPRACAAGRWYSRLLSPGEGVPYGIAISASGLALLPLLALGGTAGR